MSEVGTLRELGVGVGDVVEWMESPEYGAMNVEYAELITSETFRGQVRACLSKYGAGIFENEQFRIISRANHPKPWSALTDAEKGALLLAHHEGKVIEFCAPSYGEWASTNRDGNWYGNISYRVKPEPKIETHNHIVCAMGEIRKTQFNTIDGKVDWESLKVLP